MEKRNLYIQKLEESLTQYNNKLVEMKEKAAEVKEDVQAEYFSQIEKLEHKRDDFIVKYEQLKESSEHAWDDVKTGTEKAWSEFENSIKEAVSRFK